MCLNKGFVCKKGEIPKPVLSRRHICQSQMTKTARRTVVLLLGPSGSFWIVLGSYGSFWVDLADSMV